MIVTFDADIFIASCILLASIPFLILLYYIMNESMDIPKKEPHGYYEDEHEFYPSPTVSHCAYCGKVVTGKDIAFSIDMARGQGLPVCNECDRKYKVVYDLCDQEGGVYQYHWEDR